MTDILVLHSSQKILQIMAWFTTNPTNYGMVHNKSYKLGHGSEQILQIMAWYTTNPTNCGMVHNKSYKLWHVSQQIISSEDFSSVINTTEDRAMRRIDSQNIFAL